jgi:hypothetical protein
MARQIQFSVGAGDLLDLTVFEIERRVILGLPNDVIVWSVFAIFAVTSVSGRKLAAGSSFYHCGEIGAHVYALNQSCHAQLLRRQPLLVSNPIY